MRRDQRAVRAFLALALAESGPLSVGVARAEAPRFYVVSNKADANTVVGFERAADGDYVKIGEFDTGGIGTGDLEIPALEKDETHPLANGDDPLISAHAIISVEDADLAVVVNPGDASLSLMRIEADGGLSFASRAPPPAIGSRLA